MMSTGRIHNVNKVNQLAELLGHGGKSRISEMCVTSVVQVSRWVKAGKIPARYNERLRSGLLAHAEKHNENQEWLMQAVNLLEPDECPTCGQTLEMKK